MTRLSQPQSRNTEKNDYCTEQAQTPLSLPHRYIVTSAPTETNELFIVSSPLEAILLNLDWLNFINSYSPSWEGDTHL